MEEAQNTIQKKALGMTVFASFVRLAGGFAFVSWEFGFRHAAIHSLLLVPPLVAALRLRRRWPAVRARELAFLAVLLCVATGGGAFVVQAWYVDGLDRDHAEDMRWAEFERRMRRNSAFRDVQVHKSERKNIHWASGTVSSEADLDRLRALAVECGIEGRLDGPYAHSVSLTVTPPPDG